VKYLNGFFKSWKGQAAAQTATLSVLVATYTIVVLTLLLHQNLEHILSRWGSEVKMNVYLKDEIPEAQKSVVRSNIEKLGLFESVAYVSKDEALSNFQKRMGSLAPSILEDKDVENPSSFEAVLSPSKARSSLGQLPEVAQTLAALAGIEDISYGQGWIENYASVLKVFRISSAVLVLILSLGCLLVIGNSIKSSVISRRDEIEVMELFGATPGMIMAPFLTEGAMMGFVAAALALAVSSVLYAWQSLVLVEGLGFWGISELLSFLAPWKCFLVLLLGTIMGSVGSYLCVRQINTGWAAAEK
jgi:cell division transport system permease protein